MAVFVPPGVYRITRMLEISQSNVVVRGAGPGKSILYFPTGLKALYGAWVYGAWVMEQGSGLGEVEGGHVGRMPASH